MLKTKTVTIETDGDDKGKSFLITRMSAFKTEKWATRALGGMARAGLTNAAGATGTSGLMEAFGGDVAALLDAFLRISWVEAEPLLDEMLACVQKIPSLGIVLPLLETDIDSVMTLLELRMAWFELHFDFFGAAGPSTSATKAPDAAAS